MQSGDSRWVRFPPVLLRKVIVMSNKDPEHYDYDDDEYKNYPHEDYAEFYKNFGKMSDDEIQEMWQKWIDDVLDEILMDGNTIYFGLSKYKDKDETKKFPVYLCRWYRERRTCTSVRIITEKQYGSLFIL